MITLSEATKIIKRELPFGRIGKHIEYMDLYIFQVFLDFPDEEDMDPFFSVNKNTGEFKDFSIITDGNTFEINQLFLKA